MEPMGGSVWVRLPYQRAELSPEMIRDLYRTNNFSLAGFYHNSNILDSLRFA